MGGGEKIQTVGVKDGLAASEVCGGRRLPEYHAMGKEFSHSVSYVTTTIWGGVVNDATTLYANMFGCRMETLPVKYLGVFLLHYQP